MLITLSDSGGIGTYVVSSGYHVVQVGQFDRRHNAYWHFCQTAVELGWYW